MAEVDPLLPTRRASTPPPTPSYATPSSEYVQTVATRVVYSRGYGAFYVSLLAASITEIVWIFHPWTDHCCRSTRPACAAHSPPMHELGPLPALGRSCRLAYPTSPVFFVVESYLTLGVPVGDGVAGARRQRPTAAGGGIGFGFGFGFGGEHGTVHRCVRGRLSGVLAAARAGLVGDTALRMVWQRAAFWGQVRARLRVRVRVRVVRVQGAHLTVHLVGVTEP